MVSDIVRCGMLLVALGALTFPDAAVGQDQRTVWEYSNSFGKSWFAHEGDSKWVCYLGNSTSLIYVEEERTAQSITLRRATPGLWVRLYAGKGELKRAADGPWKGWSAAGNWVDRSALPQTAVPFKDHQIRVLYFVPSDREPIPNYEAKIRVVLAYVEELYRSSPSLRRFRLKQLPFERNGDDVRIRLVEADKPASFFNAGWEKQDGSQLKRLVTYVRENLYDPARQTTLIIPETWETGPSKDTWPGHIARGGITAPDGGVAAYSAWILQDAFCATTIAAQRGRFFDRTIVPGRHSYFVPGGESPVFEFVENGIGGVAHELGHALGLPHDNRQSNNNIMGNGFRKIQANFNPRAPQSQRVGFSVDNARLLMSSRYLAKDVNLDDYTAPTVEVRIRKTRTGKWQFTINAADDSGLRALVIARFDSATNVLSGGVLRGRKQTVNLLLDPAINAKTTGFRFFVTDTGGNLTQKHIPLDQVE